MAKGLFTQGMCVLLREPMSIEEVRRIVNGFEVIGLQGAPPDSLDGDTLVLELDRKTGGRLLITTCATPWQDNMTDADERPDLFVAWSLGQLGPLSYPGCLERAVDQCGAWPESKVFALGHKAHLRILTSYVIGREEDDDSADAEAESTASGESIDEVLGNQGLPMFPRNYDPADELNQMMRAVSMLASSSKAVAYFNPGGEVLRDADRLRVALNDAWAGEIMPLEIWANVRRFTAEQDWSVFDTVGNEQLDIPDLELICPNEVYSIFDIHDFLRSTTRELLSGFIDIIDGDELEGPGGTLWRAMDCGESLIDPPRETVRFCPVDQDSPPAELLECGQELDDDEFDDEEFSPDDSSGFDADEYADNQGAFDPPRGFSPDDFDDSDLDDDLDDRDIPF